MRPYICLMELPISRPGSGNLLLGLTSVVGLIGGAYLLQCGAQQLLGKLANKKWKNKEETSEDHNCNVCCADLDLSSAKNYVTCCTCGKSVCRGPKCADWRPKDAKWECQLCQSSKESLAHTSSWVAEQMSFNQHKFVYPMRARSEVYIPIVGDGNDSSMQFESVSQVGQTASMDERAKIREYVEEIVAEMLGGNLDHIKVGQLSKSENYLQLFDKFHAKLSNLLINVENSLCAHALKGDLPAIVNGHNNSHNNNNNVNNVNNNADSQLADISQTRLRSLIETIIAETLRSSSLSASGAVSEISLDTRSHASELLANGNGLKRRHRTEHYFEPKIYQDLLATAVLNKIADKEGNTRLLAESTPDLSGRHIDENFNAEALSTTSGSSIEPRSDCSLTDHEIGLDNGKSQSLQADLERESVLSDYIAAHMVPLPDFSASVTESEDDIGSISSGMIGDGNWEDNWLFKKKRSSATPSSVGMLVPAPRENVRAQIGDKTTDEVSDLSEIGSDIEESSLDLLRCNDLNDRLLSKHLIGGQNTKLVLDELVDRTSLTSHTLLEEHEPAFTETTNEFVVSPMAVPSDIRAPSPNPPPPPPMIFQDDLLNEEPDHTPIAAQGETEELASLEGCTGFGTVEYIDEEQMHETVPSVIEILAAMALGPMLAVPASEQPGAMTPSEMHTLKELSDLALAEINARTVELVHLHSLDIIEEENTEPSEIASEPHFDVLQPPPLTEITTSLEQENVIQEDIVLPPPPLELVSQCELFAPMDVVPETVEPTNPAEVVSVLDGTTTAEVVSETKSEESLRNSVACLSAPEEIEPQPVAADIPAPLATILEPQSDLEPMEVSETRSADVEPLGTIATVLETQSSELEIPAPLEIIGESEHPTNTVDLPAPVGFHTQAEPVVEEPEPETQLVTEDPPTNVAETVHQVELVAVTAEPAEPIEVVLVDSTPPEEVVLPAPLETDTEMGVSKTIEKDAQTTPVPDPVVVELQAPVEHLESITETQVSAIESQNVVPEPIEVDSIPQSVDVEPSAPLDIPLEVISAPIEVVQLETTEEVILKTESLTVDPPVIEEVVSNVESVDVVISAPLEINPEVISVPIEVVQLKTTEEIISETPLVAVDPPIDPTLLVELLSEIQTLIEEPYLVVSPEVPEIEPVFIKEPESAEVPIEVNSINVEQPSPIEAEASVEIVSESQVVVESEPEEINPEMQAVAEEPSSTMEMVLESQSIVADPPSPIEDVSHVESVDVNQLVSAEVILLDEPTEIIPTVVDPLPLEEVDPQAEIVNMPEPMENYPPTPVATVDQDESSAPPQSIPESESIAADPLSLSQADSAAVSLPTPLEILPETQAALVDPILNIEMVLESVAKETSLLEIVSETQLIAMDEPTPVDVALVSESARVDQPATLVQTESVAVEAEIVPEIPIIELDAPESIEVVDIKQPEAAEVAHLAESVEEESPKSGENLPETESLALETVVSVEAIPAIPPTVDSVLPLEVSLPSHIVDVVTPVPVEMVAQAEPVAVSPPCVAEGDPETQVVAMEQPEPTEIVPDSQAVPEEPPTADRVDSVPVQSDPSTTEVLSEAETEQPVPQIEPFNEEEPATVASQQSETMENVAIEPPSPVERPREPEEVVLQPAEVDVKQPEPAENIQESHSVTKESLVTENKVSNENPPVLLAESINVEPPNEEIVCQAIPEESLSSTEIVLDTESVVLDSLEVNAESVALEATSEVDAEKKSFAVEPTPPVEVVLEEQASTGEVIAPMQNVAVVQPIVYYNVAEHEDLVDVVPEGQVAAVIAPVEPDAGDSSAEVTDVEPKAPETSESLKDVLESESVAMELIHVAPETESVAEDQTFEVEAEQEALSVELQTPVDVVPEGQVAAVKALLEPVAGDSSSAAEVTDEQPTAPESSESLKVVLESNSVDVNPNEVVPGTVESLSLEELVSQSEVIAGETQETTEDTPPLESIKVGQSTPIEAVPVEPIALVKIDSQTKASSVDPPDTTDEVAQAESVSGKPSESTPSYSETKLSIIAVKDLPESEELVAEKEYGIIELQACVEIVPETQSVLEDEPQSQSVIINAAVVEAESIAVVPIDPLEIVPDVQDVSQAVVSEIKSVAMDPSASTKLDDLEKTVSQNIDPQEELLVPVEVVPELMNATGEALVAVEDIAQVESVSLEPIESEEPISQSESIVVDSPPSVNVASQKDSLPISSSEPTSIEASEKLIPETDSATVGSPETAQESQQLSLEHPAPAELGLESADVDSQIPLDIISKTNSIADEPPSTEGVPVPQSDSMDVKEETVLELHPAALPTAVEISPEIHSGTKETIAPVEIETHMDTKTVPVLPAEPQTDAEEVPPSTEVMSSEPQSLGINCITDAKTLTSEEPKCIATNVFQPDNEIVPELQSAELELQKSTPATPPTAVEIVPEVQTDTKETIVPMEMDTPMESTSSVEVSDIKSVPVFPPVETEETGTDAQKVSSEETSIALIPTSPTLEVDCIDTLTSDEPKSITTGGTIPASIDNETQSNTEVVPEGIQRNASIDSTKSDCSALGKASHKYLRRQPNILDTTPSDGESPKRSEPVNLLGTICKVYIKDKRLLATIERRRRRSLIMHKYLSSFDSMDDSIEEVPYESHHSNLFEELNEDSLASSKDLQPPTGRAETPTSEVDPIRFVDDCFAFDTDKTETDMVDELSMDTDRYQALPSTKNIVESHSKDSESEIETGSETSLDTDISHCSVSTQNKHESLDFESESDITSDACLEIDASECSYTSEDKHEDHLSNLDEVVTVGDNIILRLDMASQTSCDMSEELEVESDSIIAFSLSEITYNFINEILFSDQLSSESIKSDESEPSTACETFNGDGDSELEFVSERVLVLDNQRSLNTNTSSNNNLHNHLHLPLTQTNHPTSGSRRTNGKLTNGSLRWSGSYTTELPNSGSLAAQQDDDVADDDVVLLRRFVPGSIAEREVKKWYNAVEMPNNPYAPEALKQRISGTQERYMDVPNISPSAEQKALASALTENPDPPSPKTDYKRYSRDYYINNAATPTDSTGSGRAAASPPAEDVEDIVINEVNQEPEPHPPHGRISSSAQSTAADLSHWTLSTPVRRSSSLKFINSRPSPARSLGYERSPPLERPSTSASHYRESGLGLGLGDDDDFDSRSQRSWRSSYSSLPKRHTQSSLSLHSNGSGMSFGSSVSKRRSTAGGSGSGGPSAGVLTQFEKQLLHKDLKRNSFRAVSATSKDFVMNPLFESEPLGGKLAVRPEAEDQGDSGVDSCLNGFSGADTKYSNNSLLF
ncbi:hypothetical protein KR084_003257 [Drosophila pseudotakahashii]|nr:hypothetical protein KR084_003257 [Drosophila pseudotakahashii]